MIFSILNSISAQEIRFHYSIFIQNSDSNSEYSVIGITYQVAGNEEMEFSRLEKIKQEQLMMVGQNS